jgi:hypothetical protein
VKGATDTALALMEQKRQRVEIMYSRTFCLHQGVCTECGAAEIHSGSLVKPTFWERFTLRQEPTWHCKMCRTEFLIDSSIVEVE